MPVVLGPAGVVVVALRFRTRERVRSRDREAAARCRGGTAGWGGLREGEHEVCPYTAAACASGRVTRFSARLAMYPSVVSTARVETIPATASQGSCSKRRSWSREARNTRIAVWGVKPSREPSRNDRRGQRV